MTIEDQTKQAATELDEHVAEIIKWHFSPDTGSTFWLDWANEQSWNPLEEVKTFQDICEKVSSFSGRVA